MRQTQERLIVVADSGDTAEQSYSAGRAGRHLLARADATAQSKLTVVQGYGAANSWRCCGCCAGICGGWICRIWRLRGVYLQGVGMQDSRLVNATIQDCVFTETFEVMGCVAISPNGEYWAASSRRGEIRIWEAGGRLLLQAWRGHADMIWGINSARMDACSPAAAGTAWSSCGRFPADACSGQADTPALPTAWPSPRMDAPSPVRATIRMVQIWDIASGALLRTLPHPSPVPIVIWSPDGQLISGDVEGVIRVWAMNQTGANRDHPDGT